MKHATKKVPEYRSTKPTPVLTRAEVLKQLTQMDHCFSSESFARAACKAFAVSEIIQAVVVDSTEFKGLNVAFDDEGERLPDGTRVYGADAADLARHLCRELGVPFMHQYGRGSQLTVCVAALAEYEAARAEK